MWMTVADDSSWARVDGVETAYTPTTKTLTSAPTIYFFFIALIIAKYSCEVPGWVTFLL